MKHNITDSPTFMGMTSGMCMAMNAMIHPWWMHIIVAACAFIFMVRGLILEAKNRR